MASLYKRRTAIQKRLWNIVQGALKNAADAHGLELTARNRNSITKRAVGTISAELKLHRDTLAAGGKPPLCPPSVEAGPVSGHQVNRRQVADGNQPGNTVLVCEDRVPAAHLRSGRAGSASTERSPLKLLELIHRDIGYLAKLAKKNGADVRAETLIEVLRMLRGRINEVKGEGK